MKSTKLYENIDEYKTLCKSSAESMKIILPMFDIEMDGRDWDSLSEGKQSKVVNYMIVWDKPMYEKIGIDVASDLVDIGQGIAGYK